MKQYRFAANDKKSAMIYESHARQMLKNAALAFSIIFGTLVLYLCLVPALANNNVGYIYFDNGISMYDNVEYSLDGVNYQPMYRLSAHREYMPQNTANINAEYVWVTPEQVSGTQISFRGTASGTVYDTVSNYQISSVTREWGYRYEDFQWISEPVALDGSWNCYFAPAKAMQYKYNGQKEVNGQTITEYFIKPEPWAYSSAVSSAYNLSPEKAPMIIPIPEAEERHLQSALVRC